MSLEPVAENFDKYNFNLGKVIRQIGAVVGLVVAIWAAIGSYAVSVTRSLAQNAVISTMKSVGIDSQSFKEMQEQLKVQSETAKQRELESTVIQSDLASVKAQNKTIIELLTKNAGNNQ